MYTTEGRQKNKGLSVQRITIPDSEWAVGMLN